MDLILVALSVFLAAFVQSVSGFGIALVAMALLPGLLGIQMATPLVALIAFTVEIILFVRYRHALNIKAIWRIVFASLVGIPFGIILLNLVDPKVIMTILGVVVAGYSIYGLLNIHLPELKHPMWAYGTGFVAGILGGAYNTSGPPVIIYGDCHRWPPAEFKSNLQGFFLVASFMVVAGHAVVGNIDYSAVRYYVIAIPAIGLGILTGVSLDPYINPSLFRKIILIFLAIMGFRLMF